MILTDTESAETRAELRDVIARVLDRELPRTEQVNRADAAAAGTPHHALWDRLLNEIGSLGLAVPEGAGGSGATFAETAVVLELLSRRVAPVPVLGSVLAVEALMRSAADPAQEWLGQVASGQLRATVAFTALRVDEADGQLRAHGSLPTVMDACNVDLIIAPAGDGPRWVALQVDTETVHSTQLSALDLTRNLCDVVVEGATATELSAEPGFGAHLTAVATLCLAIEQLGVAEQAVDDAVAYAKEREQFGRKVGSFQALKHVLADMATEADLARSMVEHATWVAVTDPDELPTVAAMAKLAASRAAVFASGENVQVHAGIGFSWEHHAHLYFRRARSNDALVQSPEQCIDLALTTHRVES